MYGNRKDEICGDNYYEDTQIVVEEGVAQSLPRPTKKGNVARGVDLQKVNRVAEFSRRRRQSI